MRQDSLKWIAAQCRFKPRTIEILGLIWIDGLSRPGTARLLGIKTSTVQKLEGRAKHKIQTVYDAAGPGEKALWESMLAEEDESQPLSWRGHVKALLRAMRGPAPSAPASPEYDVLGREIGCRPPIVSVDEAIAAIIASEQERGRTRSQPLWRANYG